MKEAGLGETMDLKATGVLYIYEQLMVKLRNEDHASFTNILRMPPDMYDELLRRVGPRITKTYTHYREPLEPAGLKLVLTLHHLANGNKYASMKFAWRVPHNTISVACPPEVCELFILISQSNWFSCRNSSMDFSSSSVRQHAVFLARFCL